MANFTVSFSKLTDAIYSILATTEEVSLDEIRDYVSYAVVTVEADNIPDAFTKAGRLFRAKYHLPMWCIYVEKHEEMGATRRPFSPVEAFTYPASFDAKEWVDISTKDPTDRVYARGATLRDALDRAEILYNDYANSDF